MALLSTAESATLDAWNLNREFDKNRQRFVHYGRIVFRAFQAARMMVDGATIRPEDIVPAITEALSGSPEFDSIVKRKAHMRSNLYGVICEAMAKKLLDEEWDAISGG